MNAKRKGNRNEHRSIALLESAAYRCWRSAAKLGDWDAVGVGLPDVVVVQVKTNAWFGAAEMEGLGAFAMPTNCRKLIHRWRDRNCRPNVLEVGA